MHSPDTGVVHGERNLFWRASHHCLHLSLASQLLQDRTGQSMRERKKLVVWPLPKSGLETSSDTLATSLHRKCQQQKPVPWQTQHNFLQTQPQGVAQRHLGLEIGDPQCTPKRKQPPQCKAKPGRSVPWLESGELFDLPREGSEVGEAFNLSLRTDFSELFTALRRGPQISGLIRVSSGHREKFRDPRDCTPTCRGLSL